MGIFENKTIDESQLIPYLKEGITMSDLINLKKNFLTQKLTVFSLMKIYIMNFHCHIFLITR